MKRFAYLENVATLELNRVRCVGCGMCAHICPQQVFLIRERKSEIVERDACMECGACALNCPVDALQVDAGVGCASGIITEWWRERFPGKKGGAASGCC